MLGQTISFASFAIVECMTSTKFHIKSIGYLAASQCFDKETEVAVLVVNLVKKDLTSPPTPLFSTSPSSLTVAHLSMTLSAVSLLLTPTLARDLAPDILSLLSHSRPAVRKQTMLVLGRVVRSWPGVMELSTGREERGDDPWIERLRERLSDDDQSVVSATVNLVCELARKKPRRYLPLAPELFELLTASTNNWMLIKIIKLFAALTPEEPRLVRKLLPPLTELIETTPAMSLLYECIKTSIVGGMLTGREGEALAATCVDKLKAFLEDVDQNLRYIALLALVKILPTHPHLLTPHHDIILSCVDDSDVSIRMRALDLVEGMVDRSSLRLMVEKLMSHLRPSTPTSEAGTSAAAASLLRAQQHKALDASAQKPHFNNAYRTHLVALILRMCSQQTFANVSNFAWYIDTLVELSYIALSISQEPSQGQGSADKAQGSATATPSLGQMLRDQLIDVTARVKAIRPYAVTKMAELLGDEEFLENGEGADVAEVLGAAAWICGEYCRELPDSRHVIASLFGTTQTNVLPPRILSLYIHNGLKIYAQWLSALAQDWSESAVDQVRSISTVLEAQLTACTASDDIELQERAAEFKALLELVRKGLDNSPQITSNKLDQGFTSDDLDPHDSPQDDAIDASGAVDSKSYLRVPPSLTLLEPLFFSHELNPVNPKAQGMVALPAGLDIDAAIVPEAMSRLVLPEDKPEGEVDAFGRRTRDPLAKEAGSKSGKRGKKTMSSNSKKSSRRKAREADEIEQDDDDVDFIPIVQLDISLSSPLTNDARATEVQPPQPPPREPTPPPMHVDVDGELPDGVELDSSISIKQHHDEEDQDEKVAVPARVEVRAEEGTVKKVVKKKRKDGAGGTKKKSSSKVSHIVD
ncbi:AP-3 complex subunit delta [Microbotryomycetes sp. JL221]|nr:AP-3 complex subunit delta [Microbotryomycetes sp. JL221]